MHLSLYVSACGTRLTASLTGPVSYADRRRALDVVCQRGKAEGIDRYLIDFTLAWHSLGTPEEKASFFHALRDRREFEGARIAYLNCPEGNIVELREAAAQVGFTAGIFGDRSAAIDWLQRDAQIVPARPLAFGRGAHLR
ncbi:hypothetical protein [Noviluteimonas gilva]|uniref:STAS/SEC14 domain-containing protein n=1 Tax=Noviluteimonas gilva TaxID=2682097 RepID=A0A7C9HVC0_9GAMM|nr:hypothetical protein [Lysobacter gilvus]MUV14318.1 hypothetical protein [Lysobacter gilvus]